MLQLGLKALKKNHELLYLPMICLTLFVISFFFESPVAVFKGYYNIMVHPSILLTDYFAIGGVGATLLNAATIMLFNLIMLVVFKVNFTGVIYAGILIITGFSFFGKNIINTLPIYAGVLGYTLLKKENINTMMPTILFSSGISPLVSYSIFGTNLAYYISVPFGIVCGLLAGFILPCLLEKTKTFSNSCNLYNTGFSLGIISVFFYSVFRILDIEVVTNLVLDNTHKTFLILLLVIISVVYLLGAVIAEPTLLKKYSKLLQEVGTLGSDFLEKYGPNVIMFNFGILGLFSALIVMLIPSIPMDGIVFGTILAALGFSSYGLQPRNLIPVWLGAILEMLVSGHFFDSMTVVMAFFFVSCLAPITGKYSFVAGILAGFLHLMINPLLLDFQGGFDLYNNGFCAGFVAFFVSAIFDSMNKFIHLSKEKDT